MKKVLSILLITFMIFSINPFVSAEDELTIIADGGFEKESEYWDALGEGSEKYISTGAHEGSKALELTAPSNFLVKQIIYLEPNEKYDLSVFVKNNGEKANGLVKLEYYAVDKQNVGQEDTGTIESTKDWTETKKTFTTPDKTNFAILMVRLLGGGTIYYDSIKLDGKMAAQAMTNAASRVKKEKGKSEKPAVAGQEKNLFPNPGFETLDKDGNPEGYSALGGWGKYATLEKKEVHSGNYSVKIETKDGGNPYVFMDIKDLLPSAKYQISFWYKGEIRGNNGLAVKFENYSANTFGSANGLLSDVTEYYGTTSTWKQVFYTVEIPENGTMQRIYPRMYSNDGTVYIDDFKYYMVEGPIKYRIATDQVFYYENLKSGEATVRLNMIYEDDGLTADFKLLDGEKVLASENAVEFNNKQAKFKYDLSLLTSKKKEYIVKATVKNAGAFENELTQKIYRYDRPTSITEDGIYMVDGKPFNPVLMYHLYETADIKTCVDNGVNVMQGLLKKDPAEQLKYLDEMQKIGMKVEVVLYFDMKPAGHPQNIETTKAIVSAVKNHPAVFGYMIMDEPFANDQNIEPYLLESYKAIRDIDDKHPVLSCECWENCFEATGKYVDLLVIDPYPGAWNDYGTHVGKKGEAARKILNYNKPVLNLLQVFSFGGVAPEVHEVRNMIYQSYLANNQYIGFYPFKAESKAEVNLDKSIYWSEITSFIKLESQVAAKHFTTYEYPTYNKYKDDKIQYESWTDGKDIYTILLNRTKDTIDAKVSLKSTNGKLVADNYEISVVNGGNIADVAKGNGEFSVKLSSHACVLYKTSANLDFAKLSESAFEDIAEYTWAADAINTLFSKGIVNKKGENKYAPGTSITRGDFAMFLVRTLGLTLDSNDNFDDVDKNAEYAKEIAIGKAAGILNGVGDNKFSPEATITRQDMMTIISRGMGLYGEAEISAFSDSGKIASYALSHVKAMIASGLIKGNADGTINPLGNATRAEAAVIMSRILK